MFAGGITAGGMLRVTRRFVIPGMPSLRGRKATCTAGVTTGELACWLRMELGHYLRSGAAAQAWPGQRYQRQIDE